LPTAEAFFVISTTAVRIGVDLVSEELRDWIETNPTRDPVGSHTAAT
jgi:hypothetical protein